MSTRHGAAASAAVTAFLFACGGPSSAPNPTPVADPAVPVPAATATVASPAPAPVPAQTLSGQEVVEQICSQCHSMEPPPLAAPPLTHLSRHLRESFASVEEAVAHVLAYAPAPDAEASILPPMAVERFGLMPPQPLPEPMLDAAARYIWSLSEGVDLSEPMGMQRGQGGGMGQGMHQGQGMQRGQGGGMGQGMHQGQAMQRGQGGGMGQGMHQGQAMQRGQGGGMGQGMHQGQGMQRGQGGGMGQGMHQGQGMGAAGSCPMHPAAGDSTAARPRGPRGGGGAA